jgi:Flp pilus assembly pilin Flp
MPFDEPDEPSGWQKLEYVLLAVLGSVGVIAVLWSALASLL